MPDYIEGKRIKIEQENKRIIDTNKKAILKPGTITKKNEEIVVQNNEVKNEDTTTKSQIKTDQPAASKSQKKVSEKPLLVEKSPENKKVTGSSVSKKHIVKSSPIASSKSINKTVIKDKKEAAITASKATHSKVIKKSKTLIKK